MNIKNKILLGATTLASLPLTGLSFGKLVEKAGVSEAVAWSVVAVLSSGGLYAAAAAWPLLAPFLGTAKAIAAIAGTSAVVAF